MTAVRRVPGPRHHVLGERSRPIDLAMVLAAGGGVTIAAAVAGDDDWEMVRHEKRPRPAGASSHHVDDIILRLVRKP